MDCFIYFELFYCLLLYLKKNLIGVLLLEMFVCVIVGRFGMPANCAVLCAVYMKLEHREREQEQEQEQKQELDPVFGFWFRGIPSSERGLGRVLCVCVWMDSACNRLYLI